MALIEWFLPRDGIDKEVITADICRYLGNDAAVRLGTYENPYTRQITDGYFITSYRNLTLPLLAMIADLKTDTARWERERSMAALQSVDQFDFCKLGQPNSIPIMEHITPQRKDLPILIDGEYVRACADFGASANLVSYQFVQERRLPFTFSHCQPFELPTFGKLIWPLGIVELLCEFPGEPETQTWQTFFVVRDFVHTAIIGRVFLRQTQTLDLHRHRLKHRPLVIHEAPIVAFLGSEEETLRYWLDGELLTSTPDTGSEINVMSLAFAQQRGFTIEPDHVNQVRFADGTLQDVVGLVKVPVSFGNGAPPSLLLNLVSLSTATPSSSHAPIMDPKSGKVDYRGQVASILAEFHILDGLRVEVIFGEDLLATVNAFVCHSTDFQTIESPESFYPGLGTIGLVRKAGQKFCELLGKQKSEVEPDPAYDRDIADSKELDRHEREQRRAQTLSPEKRQRAERKNEVRRKEYLARRGP